MRDKEGTDGGQGWGLDMGADVGSELRGVVGAGVGNRAAKRVPNDTRVPIMIWAKGGGVLGSPSRQGGY